MSEQTSTNGTASTDGTLKPRRRRAGPRGASKAKAAFIVLQVMDANGTPQVMDKKNVKLLGIERNSDKVLELIDSGSYENAFYLRGMIEPTR